LEGGGQVVGISATSPEGVQIFFMGLQEVLEGLLTQGKMKKGIVKRKAKGFRARQLPALTLLGVRDEKPLYEDRRRGGRAEEGGGSQGTKNHGESSRNPRGKVQAERSLLNSPPGKKLLGNFRKGL